MMNIHITILELKFLAAQEAKVFNVVERDELQKIIMAKSNKLIRMLQQERVDFIIIQKVLQDALLNGTVYR